MRHKLNLKAAAPNPQQLGSPRPTIENIAGSFITFLRPFFLVTSKPERRAFLIFMTVHLSPSSEGKASTLFPI